MAQEIEQLAGQKRGAGRPPKSTTPAAKRTRLSTSISTIDVFQPSPAIQSPAVSTPTLPEREKKALRLPSKLSDSKPLPTLSTPQPTTSLFPGEYQSIAASAVLTASLHRSQLKWTHEGIFARYWTQPESGKNARPPPPNNPDVKWMKAKGECRIRIEPHVLECQMYVEEKPKVVKQYAPPTAAASASPYGQPYRPQQQQQQQYGMGQPYQPYQQTHTVQQQNRTLPPINNIPPPPVVHAAAASSTPPDKKPNPDPVISMLAARASSDIELKGLMKEVATGNANPEQLRIFQRHIDELQKIIKDEKEAKATKEASSSQHNPQDEVIQYDGANDTQPSTPQPLPYHHQQHPQPPKPYTQTSAAPPTPPPVILAFTTPGATEDRFLFPRHTILEPLSAHHLLCSFLITSKPPFPTPLGLTPGKEYYQPITLMVEVKYNLEHLLTFIKQWVLPAEEVRKDMLEIMARCERAPEAYLALRLPVKSAGNEMLEEGGGGSSVEASKEATPVSSSVVAAGEGKARKSVKFVKPNATSKAKASAVQGTKVSGEKTKKGGSKAAAAAAPQPQSAKRGGENQENPGSAAQGDADEAAAAAETTTDSGRPRRATRKSSRLSEG